MIETGTRSPAERRGFLRRKGDAPTVRETKRRRVGESKAGGGAVGASEQTGRRGILGSGDMQSGLLVKIRGGMLTPCGSGKRRLCTGLGVRKEQLVSVS